MEAPSSQVSISIKGEGGENGTQMDKRLIWIETIGGWNKKGHIFGIGLVVQEIYKPLFAIIASSSQPQLKELH